MCKHTWVPSDPPVRCRGVEAVEVLARDPELGVELKEPQRAEARRRAIARVLHVPEGPWDVSPEEPRPPGHFGLLLLDGVLARDVALGNRTGIELLGPGDLLRPWVRLGNHSSIHLEEGFMATEPASFAVLDPTFARAIAPWPAIGAALMDRLALRSRWIAFHLAVCHLRRVDTRLLVVLWYLGDRWGRVTPEGVRLPVRLTHRLLAGVIGAERSSVSKAVQTLRRRRKVRRQVDGSWMLLGDPPSELRTVHERSVGPTRASASSAL